jgi:hypothetical protein
MKTAFQTVLSDSEKTVSDGVSQGVYSKEAQL